MENKYLENATLLNRSPCLPDMVVTVASWSQYVQELFMEKMITDDQYQILKKELEYIDNLSWKNFSYEMFKNFLTKMIGFLDTFVKINTGRSSSEIKDEWINEITKPEYYKKVQSNELRYQFNHQKGSIGEYGLVPESGCEHHFPTALIHLACVAQDYTYKIYPPATYFRFN